MKTKTLVISALLFAGLAASANAQMAAYGDLILGFEASGGTGASTNVEVNLGSIANYASQGPGTYALGNLGTDLSNTYGSGWASRSDLTLAIVGSASPTVATDGYVKKTIFASSAESGSFPASAWQQSGGTLYNGPLSSIGAIYGLTNAAGAFGGGSITNLADVTGSATAVGTTLVGISTGTGTSGSWTSFQQADGAFAIPNPTGVLFYTNAAGITGGTGNLDLYVLAPVSGASATNLGFFSLSDTGLLSFNVVGVAIPEPSTYAAILGAAALGFVMLRRRKQALT